MISSSSSFSSSSSSFYFYVFLYFIIFNLRPGLWGKKNKQQVTLHLSLCLPQHRFTDFRLVFLVWYSNQSEFILTRFSEWYERRRTNNTACSEGRSPTNIVFIKVIPAVRHCRRINWGLSEKNTAIKGSFSKISLGPNIALNSSPTARFNKQFFLGRTWALR